MKFTQIAILVTTVAVLSACSDAEIVAADPNPMPHDSVKKGPGLFSGESGNILDAFRPKTGTDSVSGALLGVNTYLWRASLEAVAFLPISQADSTGGVIITDWYENPQKTGEKVKVNVYIMGKKLQPQALKVTVFKQKFNGNNWVDVAVSPETAAQIEESILTKARIARVKERAAK